MIEEYRSKALIRFNLDLSLAMIKNRTSSTKMGDMKALDVMGGYFLSRNEII